MDHTTHSKHAGKSLTYGQCQAVKVLVAQRLGLSSACTEDAVKLMQGTPVHPMHSAAVDSEATRVHNDLAGDPDKVSRATIIGNQVLVEYGFAHLASSASNEARVTQ